MRRFVYPAVLMGLCGLMLWTHFEMFSDIRSNWTVGAILSTGFFLYVALVRHDPATDAPHAFPMEITELRLTTAIAVSVLVLGAAAIFERAPDSVSMKVLAVLFDGIAVVWSLGKSYGWAWPLGPVDIKDIREDNGL